MFKLIGKENKCNFRCINNPYLDLCLIVIAFLRDFFEDVNFENSKQTTTKTQKITQHAKS